jgi:hypothetical protein
MDWRRGHGCRGDDVRTASGRWLVGGTCSERPSEHGAEDALFAAGEDSPPPPRKVLLEIPLALTALTRSKRR